MTTLLAFVSLANMRSLFHRLCVPLANMRSLFHRFRFLVCFGHALSYVETFLIGWGLDSPSLSGFGGTGGSQFGYSVGYVVTADGHSWEPASCLLMMTESLLDQRSCEP